MAKRIDLDVDYIKEQYECGSTLSSIAQQLNVNPQTIANRLSKLKVPLRGNVKNLLGKRFGSLVVLSSTDKKTIYGVLWECVCDCGKRCYAQASRLLNGRKRSCGCLQKRIGDSHPGWKGCGEISGEFWAGIKHGATSRHYCFEITINEAWELFLAQNRKCKLTGIEIGFSQRSSTASLDRINNQQGYVFDNVQWLHKDVNFMKQAFDEAYFIELCKKVAGNS